MTIRVTNSGSGHKFPTGFPEGRVAWVAVRAFDLGSGRELDIYDATWKRISRGVGDLTPASMQDRDGDFYDDAFLSDTRLDPLPHAGASRSLDRHTVVIPDEPRSRCATANGAPVPASVDQIGDGTWALFRNQVFFKANETYTARIDGRLCGFDGRCVTARRTWRFTTAPEDGAGQGDTRVPVGFVHRDAPIGTGLAALAGPAAARPPK